MLYEPTTLAATTTALADALETYGCDPKSVFQKAGLSFDELAKPGSRYPISGMSRLWKEARAATGDPCIGIFAARKLKPQALHALGLSWIASRTLLDGFQRMARYSRIANTSLRIRLSEQSNQIKLVPEFDSQFVERPPESADATLAFIVTLCRLIMNNHFSPLLVTFEHKDVGHTDEYVEFFGAPVYFSKKENALYFDAALAKQPVLAGNESLAKDTDQIAERYLATLEPQRVQDRVREILLNLLPSGEADQSTVARSLNRSVSALQRQLKAEGASYRQVLDETRQTMAVNLVEERRYSLGQIAYLLGFSEQASFTRAFKRWTGSAPTDFR